MSIHKEGYRTILFALSALLVINVLLYLIIPDAITPRWVIGGVSLMTIIFLTQFFRRPVRVVVPDDHHILAPADGKIVVLEKTTENEYSQQERIQVSIFMSVFDVHMNLFPISGWVKYIKYHPGRFFYAHLPKSSDLNERTSLVLENKGGKQVFLRQIAGGLARRIVCYANEGQHVTAGEELGFIKFGSRVDILLPTDTEILVKLNQKVKGGKTVIARF